MLVCGVWRNTSNVPYTAICKTIGQAIMEHAAKARWHIMMTNQLNEEGEAERELPRQPVAAASFACKKKQWRM